ncbi:MAG: helix-turn-helix transcriptional regulator, partial [Omnitrophica WOR_2 bacterium]
MSKKGKTSEQSFRLLRTKLNVPRLHPDVVDRSWLIRRLNEGLSRKLIVVSAPAGSGKTTLLSAWVEQCHFPVAWVSLDRRDNDPVRFWAYLITALQSLAPGAGAATLDMLQSPQPVPIEVAFTELVNELDAIQEDFILVLDDYHVVETQDIHTGLTFLIENLPGSMHLVIAGRSDPALPLPQYRAR